MLPKRTIELDGITAHRLDHLAGIWGVSPEDAARRAIAASVDGEDLFHVPARVGEYIGRAASAVTNMAQEALVVMGFSKFKRK